MAEAEAEASVSEGSWKIILDELLEEFAPDIAIGSDPDISDNALPATGCTTTSSTTQSTSNSTIVEMSTTVECVSQLLGKVTPAFSFYSATQKLQENPSKVSELGCLLHGAIISCVKTSSSISGINREASQSAFFMLASRGLEHLTAITCDRQLTVWLSLQTFERFLDVGVSGGRSSEVQTVSITSEEIDIAHFIGGFVISKLKKRLKNTDHQEILSSFVNSSEPQKDTLLSAKSRGKLTNLTLDGQSMFAELELVFRNTFQGSTETINQTVYEKACQASSVVQDCYFSATYTAEHNAKETVLSQIIGLYFKVRVYQRCRTLIDSVRLNKKKSSKENSLRSRLSK